MPTNATSVTLRSGLFVEVVTNGSQSKTLFFSKPVRGVELNQYECTQLASCLSTRENGPRPMAVIRHLLQDGYFDDPRSLPNVRDELRASGIHIRSSVISALLSDLVSEDEILKRGARRGYLYQVKGTRNSAGR